MASRCNTPLLPRNPRLSLQLLALVLTITWLFHVTESAAPIQLRGEVGGNVTFRCPTDKQRTITFLYVQRDQEQKFVNGYHATKNTSQRAWKNTRVDDDKTTIYMHSLNVSHGGDYKCHILYNDKTLSETDIHLTVTAMYSKPTVTVHHNENHRGSCLVTCASHGGYPGRKVMWNIPGGQMWTHVNSSEMIDPGTMLVNSSSTAYFNCSNEELTSLSCSVGDVRSDMFSVCTPEDLPRSDSPAWTVAAICAVVVVSIMASLLLWWKCRKGQRGAAAVEVRQINGCEEEVTILNENKEGKESP